MPRRPPAMAVFALLASAVIFAPNPAEADASADADAALARGVLLRKEGRDADALAAFRTAYASSPTPRARAQIGLAELALGLWVEAERDLGDALGAKDDPWISRYVPELERSLAIAQPHLAWLSVDGNVPGAEVDLNGARVATLPMSNAARVVAGSVVVEVRAAGYVPVKRPIDVAPGARVRESVTLVPAEGASPAPPSGEFPPLLPSPAPPLPRSGDGGAGLRVAAIVTTGVAAGGLAVGGFFGVETFVAKSDRDAHCVAAGCDPTGLAKDADARRDATISTVGFAVGLAGAAAAAILFWQAARASVTVAPAVGRNTAGLDVLGRF